MEWLSRYIRYGPAFQAAQVEEKALPLSPSCASLNGRTLLFMSDIHLCPRLPRSAVERLLAQVESLRPDMLLLGGDYAESAGWQREFFSLLGQLRVPLGIFGVVGNNDCECFPDGLYALIETAAKSGVTLLIDRTVRVDTGSGIISVAGLDEFEQAKPLRKPLFTGKDADAYRILLAHFPQSIARYHAAYDEFAPHLALTGHTHGGQFNLFGLTPYSIGYEYRMLGTPLPAVSGWKALGTTNLLVSPGIGTSKLPFRIHVEPTIHRLTLAK